VLINVLNYLYFSKQPCMAGFSDIKKGLSGMAALERELTLKQLQINRLLSITQAINNNVSAGDLYIMYHSFLSWELGVKKMALYIREDDDSWRCVCSIGLTELQLQSDIRQELPKYTRLKHLEGAEHPLVREFDVVIPVQHKEMPIAYVFIGGFADDEDMYGKVQFITTITNVIAVAIENKRLFKRQLEQERFSRELELAGEMQRMLIPGVLPDTPRYSLAGLYRPQLGVGGDYFDYREFEDGKLVFCIGDISGKGIAAALLMANFQANFHTLIDKRETLEEFIRDLNSAVHHVTGGDRFITFFVGEYHPATRCLQYINAGHNPPLLVTADQFVQLNKGCTILGSFKELPKVETGRMQIDGDAIIFLYTDGLTDLRAADGAFLDEHVLHRFVRTHYMLPPKDFNASLMEQIELFRGDQVFPDDFTLLTCRIFA
jgi:phosphoserine phosphatase RsbU/P